MATGWSVPAAAINSAGQLTSANQWICSTGDTQTGCTNTSLAAMPTGEASAASATAPCPGSMDTCVYELGSGRTVQTYDVTTNAWTSSDTGGGCANSAALACMATGIETGFAAAVDSCPSSGSSQTCIYVMGGSDFNGQVVRTFEAYDTSTNTWTSSSSGDSCASSALPCLPTARTGLGAIAGACPVSTSSAVDRCVYAIGGTGGSGLPVATVEAYDPTTNAWISSGTGGSCVSTVIACMPTARASFATASGPCPMSQSYCLYTMGGSDGSATQTVEAYDPAANTWVSSDTGGSCANSTQLACLSSPVEYAGGAGADCPGSTTVCLYVMGGFDGGAVTATNQAYDPANNTWISSDAGALCANTAIACLPTARSQVSVASASCPAQTASCLYVLGGVGQSSNTPESVVEAYDTAPVTGTSIYVSPSGNDSNPGTEFFPLRTLPHARDVVRTLNQTQPQAITVNLENGVYRLAQPLELGPQDSGLDGNNVTWTSAPGQDAIVSGGERITGWTLSNRAKNIWSAVVPAGLQSRQIYVNGMRATIDSGRAPVRLSKAPDGYQASVATMSHWRNPSQIDFVYTGQVGLMAEPICPVASIRARAINMAEPCWNNSIKRGRNLVGYGRVTAPTYIENAYELLGKPGQFYLDGSAHMLYYVPRQGEDMHTADVEAPAIQMLVAGSGTAAAPIHNLVFSNIQFSYATWLQPSTPEGFSEMQANYTLTGPHAYATEGLCHFRHGGTCPYGAWTKEPGNVQFSYDRNISFLNDRFLHLGAAALNLDNGSQDDTVRGSIFTDISGNGIEIGNVDMPQAVGAAQTIHIDISDNHLYGMPVEYHGGLAILVGYAADTTISHNQIDHVAYGAISMGWGGWLDKASRPSVKNFSHDNDVANNLIFDFMEVLSDGGAIYTQGITGTSLKNGEKVTGNVVHDQLDWSYALHSDDGSTFVTYTGNAMYDNTYDWGSNHQDFNHKPPSGQRLWDDPQVVEDNFWQQGYPNTSEPKLKLKAGGNKIITGAGQVPASILANAGIEEQYQSILSWRSPGQSVPNSPEELSVLWAFRGQAYVTWHPSFAEGNTPVTSYTVTSCVVTGPGPCSREGVAPVTVSAATFDNLGYAVVGDLVRGDGYAFQVTANSNSGESTPSISTTPTTPWGKGPHLPHHAGHVKAIPGDDLVRLLWYAPANALPLGYVVTSSTHQRYFVGGLRNFISSNVGGRVVDVIGGLTPGQQYKFSVAAYNEVGTGPAVTSGAVTPK